MNNKELYDAANGYAFDLDSGDLNTNRDTFIAGAKWMIDKACEWLKENKDHPLIECEDLCLSGYLTDEFIKNFKKAVEEQQ